MPEKLNLFLQTVSKEDAIAIWEYLDGEPNAINEMISLVVDCHKLK